MTRPLILGFAGRARAGKDSAAAAICTHCLDAGTTAGIYSISQIILDDCIKRGLIPRKQRGELNADELAVLVREGTAARKVDLQVWLFKIQKAIYHDNFEVALIPNVRFQREADFIHKRGGYIVKVLRLNQNGSTYISPDRDPNDVLETDLTFAPADFYLTANTGDQELVALQAVALYDYLIWREASRAMLG